MGYLMVFIFRLTLNQQSTKNQQLNKQERQPKVNTFDRLS